MARLIIVVWLVLATGCDASNWLMGMGAVGALVGVVNGWVQGRDGIKDGWDGAMTGVVLPGVVLGAMGGAAVASGLSILGGGGESLWVGMVSTGMAVGGVMAVGGLYGEIVQPMDHPQRVGVNALLGGFAMGYLAHGGQGLVHAYEAVKFDTDDRQHRWVMGQLVRYTDPAMAWVVGSVKEGWDYGGGQGHPEWRDLYHNAQGIWGGRLRD